MCLYIVTPSLYGNCDPSQEAIMMIQELWALEVRLYREWLLLGDEETLTHNGCLVAWACVVES